MWGADALGEVRGVPIETETGKTEMKEGKRVTMGITGAAPNTESKCVLGIFFARFHLRNPKCVKEHKRQRKRTLLF